MQGYFNTICQSITGEKKSQNSSVNMGGGRGVNYEIQSVAGSYPKILLMKKDSKQIQSIFYKKST